MNTSRNAMKSLIMYPKHEKYWIRSLCCILPVFVGKSHRRKPKSCICVHVILEIASAKKGVILCQPY